MSVADIISADGTTMHEEVNSKFDGHDYAVKGTGPRPLVHRAALEQIQMYWQDAIKPLFHRHNGYAFASEESWLGLGYCAPAGSHSAVSTALGPCEEF